jgi:hypothetical protein
VHEVFSSSVLAVLKDMNRFGQLPSPPEAAAKLTQDAQVLSWALERSPGPRSLAWARVAPNVSVTYLQAVAVRTPKPGGQADEGLARLLANNRKATRRT